ncbi:RNA-directed DNA polymerase, eukaryota [Tanacetum coccineum]
MDNSCIVDKDLSCSLMRKIKDINALSNLYVILADEGFDNVNLSYLGGFWVLIDAGSLTSKENMIKHVGVASWFFELRPADSSFVSDDRLVWISVEGLPIITWNNNVLAKIVSQWGTLSDVDTVVDPSLPFKKNICAWTPEFNNEFYENSSSDEESVKDEEINSHKVNDIDHVSKSICIKENNKFENLSNVSKKGTKSDDPFRIYKILNMNKETEDLKGDDPTFPPGFTPKVVDDKVGEDLADSINNSSTNLHSNKDGVLSGKSGSNKLFKLKSGGLILEVIEDLIEIGQAMGYNIERCSKNIEAIVGLQGDSLVLLWNSLCLNPNMFSKDNVTISDSFLVVRDVSERKSLWEYIKHMIDSWDEECVILRDFNEVRSKNERFGTIFNDNGAKAFNHFISSASLIDLPLKGYSYTWALKSASKMSKMDRFLISEDLLSAYPSLSALYLDSRLSDHRPIIMRESVVDYVLTLFRVFHSWFTKDGFDKPVSIKTWYKEDMQRSNESRFSIQSRISDLDNMLDKGMSNDDIINEQTSLLKDLQDFNKQHSLGMAQKSKIRWAIEGDENSKYFHGIINKKRSQLAIRGVLVEGEWIEDPPKVKNEFLNHFSNRFSMPTGLNISLESHMFNQIAFDQNAELESDVTYEEIKRVVWECGTNKALGPDGFTFEFIRKYWKIIQQDVVNVVHEFFASSKFPPGSNSSFITLIPKKLEMKVVKDFRPISLIGSFYKIVAKILANRLSLVISDLISEIQSAFVSKHQILDGPFILNELISWFKWRGWIQGCLTLAMGSILVNGSPSSKFKFHKGIFKGIRIDNSLTLSHLFYADDAIFIGKWDKANVITIVNMLKCFFLASGLKINIHKSKIMGIGTTQDEVNSAANINGCNTFSSPFNYLGVKMSIYKAPMGVLHKMESIRRRFFNGVDINESKMSMIGWQKIMASRKKGGLGVLSFFAQNHALLFKWIWRFRSQESSLWYRVIKAMFGEHGSLDIPDKLNDISITRSFRRPPRGGLEEEWVWSLDSSGEFSVKSAHLYIDDYFLPTVAAPTRWVKEVPIKINILAWKVSLDKLPTRLNLSLRGIEIPSISFPICSSAGESCSHLLFSCNMARLLINKVARWWELDIPDLFSYEDWLDWFNALHLLKGVKAIVEGVKVTLIGSLG